MSCLNLSDLPELPVLHQQRIIDACQADDHPDKISLTFGAYRDYEGKPWTLPIVLSTAKDVISSSDLNLDYPGPYGTDSFKDAMLSLMGNQATQLAEKRKLGLLQTVGGTSALKLSLELLRDIGATKVYTSSPTWSIHNGIAKQLGYKIKTYRYWDQERLCLDWEGTVSDIQQCEEGSVIILQLCAHNPTGVDLNISQWRQVISCVKEKGLFPLLDCAYLGLATGDLAVDREPINMFLEENIQAFFVLSMSKSLGLYGERIGALAYTVEDKATYSKVWKCLCNMAIVTYMSNNGVFAEVTSRVINDPDKRAIWECHLKEMVERLRYARQLLYDTLREMKVPGNWDHIVQQKGMFCFSGLTKPQCEFIRENHIYLYDDGRMNIGDVTDSNVKRLVTLMKDAVEQK